MEPVKKTTIYFPEELSMKEIFQCLCMCSCVHLRCEKLCPARMLNVIQQKHLHNNPITTESFFKNCPEYR